MTGNTPICSSLGISPIEMDTCPSPHLQGCCGAEGCRRRPATWMRACELSPPMLPHRTPWGAIRAWGTSPQGGHVPHPVVLLFLCHCAQMWHTGGLPLPWGAEEAQECSPLRWPWRGPERGSSTCSQSLLLPHRSSETLEGQCSAVQPCARIRPQGRGSADFPHLRRAQVLFAAEGPWAPRGQRGCACHRPLMGGECLLLGRLQRV